MTERFGEQPRRAVDGQLVALDPLAIGDDSGVAERRIGLLGGIGQRVDQQALHPAAPHPDRRETQDLECLLEPGQMAHRLLALELECLHQRATRAPLDELRPDQQDLPLRRVEVAELVDQQVTHNVARHTPLLASRRGMNNTKAPPRTLSPEKRLRLAGPIAPPDKVDRPAAGPRFS